MARGGSRGRRTSYVRDNGGRFASTPGGGPPKRSTPATRRAARPKVTGGTLGARGSLRRSRAKLAAKDPADRSLRGSLSLRAQKGAVTRGANRLGKARAASTVRMAARAGVIRGGRKVAAKPVVAPRSSVRVIRPNRPAMRPGPGPDRGKISEYVGAVRGARRRLSNAKPGTANAAEAKQGLKDNRQALSRRIQRERGARRGLKPATSQQVLTGTVPAAPARRTKAARPSGTLAKPRNLKPGAIAARKAKGAASGARAARATTNYNRAQKAAIEAQQRVNRRRSPKNQAAADKAQKTLQTAARAYRILVGLGGKKLAVARKPSPKGAGPRMKAARPAGTVAKPRGLKPDRWIKKERVIGRGEVWMGKWTPPGGGKAKRQKASAEAAKPAKTKAPSAPKINGKEWTSLSRLRGAVPFDRGRGQTGYFIPGSSLTPAKRNKLGLGAFKSEVSGGNFTAQRHTQGSQEGWIISPRAQRGETPVQIQRSKSSKKPKTADDLLTQATRIELVGRRMSRAARTGVRDRQIEARAVRAAKAARQRAFDMQKPPSKAELKRQEQRLNSRTTAGLNARLARDYAARGRR